MHYPDLGSASDWLCRAGIFFQPIRRTTKIWAVYVISMEFLRSLLRRRFARAQVATSRNVGCFLRLSNYICLRYLQPHFARKCFGQPSLKMQLVQKISLLIMHRSKRSISDFPCSDEYKRRYTVMSLVIKDWKIPYDLIRYMFG